MNNQESKILGDLGFFVGRRDVGSESKEEFLEYAIDLETNLDLITWFSAKDKELLSLIRQSKTEEKEFTFFWETKSPFSQWHKSEFIGTGIYHKGILPEQKEYIKNRIPKEVKFSSAEQYMMYHKALIFLDWEISNAIIETSNPRKIKELGRQIKNFDDEIWQYFRSNIVYQGNYLKFMQNDELMGVLADTIGTTLVEAAPNDKIWGIGLTADDTKAHQRETWEGKNLLGEILTLLRIEFMGMY